MTEANLSFLLNYTDGSKDAEIQSDLYTAAFQMEGTRHYDRPYGGNFEMLEQLDDRISYDRSMAMLCMMNYIETIYRINQKRDFEPMIVVGYNDIDVRREGEKPVIRVGYRLLNDLSSGGAIESLKNITGA